MQITVLRNNRFQLLLKGIQKRSLLLIILISSFSVTGFAQPANDDPCNAIPLTPDVICNFQTFNNTAATATAVAPAPGCANYQGGDVWFQLTVPAASNGNLTFSTAQSTGTGSITDLGMAIYRGDCNNLQLIACDDDSGPGLMPLITSNSLTVGSTIWIRCWEYGGDVFGNFDICVKYPGPPPAYDDPCNAVPLPTPTTSCTYINFTDDGATASTGAPAPGCANYTGGDVWFQVVVPAGGILQFDTQAGEVTNGGMAIYSGVDCNNLTLISCDDNSSPNGNMPLIVATGLVPGSTVWIRFWSNGLTNNTGSFGICVSIPPPPPANDEPCNAILLTATSTCNYQTFTNTSALPSTGIPDPGCANYQGGDVWFKVVVPCDGKILIDTQTGVMTDAGMAIYRGDCTGALQLIECDDNDSPNGLMAQISATSLTPGSTIYIRVWEYGNDNNGTFGICASIPPPPPPGGNCLGANSFCSSQTYTYPNSTNVPSLGGGGIYGCLGSTPNPAWYYFQVQTAGSIDIFIQQTSTTGQIVDVDFALWGPFPDLPSSCGNLSAGNIVDCSYSTSGTETANLPNAQVGEVYVLLITNFSNQPGTVTFNQTGGTGATNCNIVCTLTAGNSGPVCPGATVNLTASTVVGATYQWNGPNCFNQTGLSTQQNPTGVVVPTEPGTYIYTVIANIPGPLGSTCFAQTSVVVSAAPAIGNDTTVYICPGATTDLTALYSSSTTGLTTAWTTYPGGVAVPDPTTVSTDGVYQIIGTNSNGCNDTAYVTLIVDLVTFDVQQTTIATCTTDGSITVTNPVGIGSIFQYSLDGGPYQASNIFSASAGPHTITTQDSIGCVSTLPITVDFTNDLTLAVTPSEVTICQGQSTTLTAAASNIATTYAWLPVTGLNDPTSATPVASPTDSTLYTVTATLGSCTQTGTAQVNVDNNLAVEAGGPLSIDPGSSQQVLAVVTGSNTVLNTILWTPSAGLSSSSVLDPVLTPVISSGTATYSITVTNSNGCTATDELIVNVQPNLACRNVRNAFTPNGDGVNDYWLVYDDYSCLTNITVNVYNRYGSKVFESKDYRNNWNGRYSGKELPDGTYYAVVNFTLLNGRVVTVKSDLTLLR